MPYKVEVHDVAVDGSDPCVEEHEHVVSVIGVADTVAGEETMVVTPQDADFTLKTVVGSWRSVTLAVTTVSPL